MKFCCFTPVPWPHLEQRPEHWPFPNSSFDPDRGATCYEQAVEQLVFAEACGYDWVGVGEDHMTAYGLTPNPIVLLSIVAAQTKSIRLATMGTPLPLLNPVRVAEEMAMLDLHSRGRVVAGLIRGVPQNYAAYGIDPGESRSRFAQAVELVEKCWTHESIFAWDSEHYQFPSVSIWPRPVQQPMPPILFSGNSEASARFAATKRAMIGAIHLYNLDALTRVQQAIEGYHDVANQAGWQPEPDRFLIGLPTCIAPTDQEAFDRLGPALAYQFNVLSGTYNAEKRRLAATTPGYGLSPTEEDPPTLDQRLDAGIVLCGSPETVATQIQHLQQRLGVGLVSTHLQVGNMPHEHVLEGMRLFRDRVRPAFSQPAQLS